ncbi:MAG: hypothetical protein ACF8MF_06810 [Phycisphaerales bacterium JB052]
MTQAELKIKPSVVGNIKPKLNGLKNDLAQVEKQQSSTLKDGQVEVSRLERAYDSVGESVKRVGTVTSSITDSIFNLKTAVVGLVAGTAGTALVNSTIMAQDQLHRSQRMISVMLRDQDKMQSVHSSVRDITKEIMGFNTNQAYSALQKTLVMSDQNVDRAREMVRMGKALEALNPEQGLDGALDAIRDLEVGSIGALEQFGVFLPEPEVARKEAEKLGSSLGDWYQKALTKELDRVFGRSDVVGSGISALLGIDDGTIAGQLAHVRSRVSDLFLSIGEDAYPIINDALPRMQEAIDSLEADPQFREDIKAMAGVLTQAAEKAVDIARHVPSAVVSMREFISENETLLKLAGGAFVANKLTGGALTTGAGALIRGGVRFGQKTLQGGMPKMLAGDVIDDVVGGATSALSGAQPVYVVNADEIGGAVGGVGEGFLKRATGGVGASAGGKAISTAGMAAGGTALAATAGLAALIGGSAYTLNAVLQGTSRGKAGMFAEADAREQAALEQRQAAERRRSEREAAQAAESAAERSERETREAARKAATFLGGGMSGLGRGYVEQILGGGDQVYEGTADQLRIKEILNETFRSAGIAVDFAEGKSISEGMSFRGGRDVVLQNEDIARQSQQLDELASKLYTSDGSVRDQALMDELQSTGELDKLIEMSDSLKNLVADAERRAQQLNAAQSATPRGLDKLEVNFYGNVGDADGVRGAVDEMRDEVRGMLDDIFREDRLRTQ